MRFYRSQALLLPLQPLKELHKRRRLLRATNLKLVIDREIRHSVDILRNCILHLLVDLWSTLTRLKPLLCLRLIQSCFSCCIEKRGLRRDILLVFEVGGEEGFDDAGLHLGTLLLT